MTDDKWSFESEAIRMHQTNKRLFVLCVILIIALFVSNGAWVFYESQFVDEIQIEQEVDTGDGDAYVNGIGDLNYGEGETKGK